MKIVHMCLGNFFIDGYSYQENMLPKFHKELGYDVEVIASLVTFDSNGNMTYLDKGGTYLNEYGIKVTRLNYRTPLKIYKRFRRYINTYKTLEQAEPDILFIHNCQFLDIDIVVEYLKCHKNVKVYVDNHADFSNSATNFLSKNILHKVIWKHCAQLVNPYTEKFYGVLPARVEFLKNVYGVPAEKCELLVMGADDEKVEETFKIGSRETIRQKYGIGENEFLIMTGGKIDAWKTQTLDLMKAVRNINNIYLKLIVFGSVTQELKNSVSDLADGVVVQYIGWIDSKDAYKYFAAADLACFPGRHSVFWEQVAGMGIPMVCKYWDGTTHVDMGGNVIWLRTDTVEEIQEVIVDIIEHRERFEKMKEAAQNEGKRQFSYREIAKRSIDYIKE